MLKQTLNKGLNAVQRTSVRLGHKEPPLKRPLPASAPTELREHFEHFFWNEKVLAAPDPKAKARMFINAPPSPVYDGVARQLGYKPKKGFQ